MKNQIVQNKPVKEVVAYIRKAPNLLAAAGDSGVSLTKTARTAKDSNVDETPSENVTPRTQQPPTIDQNYNYANLAIYLKKKGGADTSESAKPMKDCLQPEYGVIYQEDADPNNKKDAVKLEGKSIYDSPEFKNKMRRE